MAGFQQMRPSALQARVLRPLTGMGGAVQSERPFQPRRLVSYEVQPLPAAWLDWDATTPVYADGAEMSSWVDTVNSVDATNVLSDGTRHPLYSTDEPMVQIAGRRHIRTGAISMPSNNDVTVLAVVDVTNVSSTSTCILIGIYGGDSFDTLIELALNYSGGANKPWVYGSYNNGSNSAGTYDDTATPTGKHVYVARRNSSGLTIWRDGVLIHTVTASLSAVAGTTCAVHIGGGDTSATSLHNLYRADAYSSALTDAQIEAVSAAMASAYGI